MSLNLELDHLIVAGPDLDEAVHHVEELLGVEAVPGGSHPGVGTRNALVGLEPRAYIEIIGPDPDQPEPELPRWFGIDALDGPRLVSWCARTSALSEAVQAGRAAGLDLGRVGPGCRLRPDGVRLAWRATDPRADRFGGVLPFLMDWGESEHPSRGLPARVRFVGLRAFHPDGDVVASAARALGLGVVLEPRSSPGLEADLLTPAGPVTLR